MMNRTLDNMYTEFVHAVVRKDPPSTIFDVIKLHNYDEHARGLQDLRGIVPYRFKDVEKLREDIKEVQKQAQKNFESFVAGEGNNLLVSIEKLDLLFKALKTAEYELAVEVACVL